MAATYSTTSTAVRYLSVGKDTESHLLPRLYVGHTSETAVSIQNFLSNQSESSSTASATILEEGTIRQLSADQAHYVTSVMRMLGPGRKKGRWKYQDCEPCVRLFDGQEEWVAQLDVLDDLGGKQARRRGKQDITVLAKCLAPLQSQSQSSAPPRLVPVLCFAPPKKKDRYQWILEKSTELGMQAWLLLRTDRMESSSSRDYERKGQSYVLEASEQCERKNIPPLLSLVLSEEEAEEKEADVFGGDEVSALSDLSSLLGMVSNGNIETKGKLAVLICRERSSSSLPILEALDRLKTQAGNNQCTCMVVIGPEGGWSPVEEASFDSLCQENAEIAKNVSLGSNVLRTDTAAVTAMAAFSLQTYEG